MKAIPTKLKLFLSTTILLLWTNIGFSALTFTWNGGDNSNWNSNANWNVSGSGGTSTYPGQNENTDIVVINLGTAGYSQHILNIPTVTIASLTITNSLSSNYTASLEPVGTNTLTVSGGLTMTNVHAACTVYSGLTLALGSTSSITQTLTINSGGGLSITAGTTTINSGGQISISGTGSITGTISNAGTLTVAAGTTTVNSGGSISSSGTTSVTGTISVASGGSLAITGGTTTINSGGTISNAGSSSSVSGTLTNNGTLTLSGGSMTINSGGLITNANTETITGGASALVISAGGIHTITTGGTTTVNTGNSASVISNSGVENITGGTLTFTQKGETVNSGGYLILTSGSITEGTCSTSNITISAGGYFINTGGTFSCGGTGYSSSGTYLSNYGTSISANSTGNWSGASTGAWPKTNRTGVISTSSSSTTVTGYGTSFTTELIVGNTLYTSGGTSIGTISSITNATTLTLTSNAASSNTTIAYQSNGVGSADQITIGSSYTVTVDNAYAAIGSTCSVSGGITISSSETLTVSAGATSISGTLTNNGTLTLSGGTTTIANGGTITNSGAETISGGAGCLTINSGGTHTISASHTTTVSSTNSTAISNSGLEAISGTLTFGSSKYGLTINSGGLTEILTGGAITETSCNANCITIASGGELENQTGTSYVTVCGTTAYTLNAGGTYVTLSQSISANATGNWSGGAWPNTNRCGIITTSNSSTTVTGIGTSFTTQLIVGNTLYTTGGVSLGTISAIGSNTSLTLTSNAASTNTNIPFASNGVGSNDIITIPSGKNVTVDNAYAVVGTSSSISSGATLTIGTGNTLTINSGGTWTNGGTESITGTLTNNGTHIISASQTTTINSGGLITNNLTETINGTLTNSGSHTVGSAGTTTISATGTYSVSATASTTVTGTITNNGVESIYGSYTISTSTGTHTVGSGVTTTIYSTGSVTNNNTETITGTLNFSGSGGTLTIASGATTSVSGTLTCTNGTVSVSAGGTLSNSGTAITSTASNLLIYGTYKHNQANGTIPTANWETGTCMIVNTSLPANLFTITTFYNVEYNTSAGTSTLDANVSGGFTTGTLTVSNNLYITSGTLALNANTGTISLTVAGNLIINGGTLYIMDRPNGDFNGTGTLTVTGNTTISSGNLYLMSPNTGSITATINFNGNLTQTGGTISNINANANYGTLNFAGTSTSILTSGYVPALINVNVNSGKSLTLGSNFPIATGCTFTNNGTLTFGTAATPYYILSVPSAGQDNTGTFTAASGSTLNITDAAGIVSAGTASGNVQSTTRSFNGGANYIYIGNAAQNTGSGLPTTISGSLQINNTQTVNSTNTGVTLSAATTVSGTVTLTAGILTTTSTNLLTVSNRTKTAISGSMPAAGVAGGPYINGPVTWQLDATSSDAYVVPVGAGGNYYPFTISAHTNAAGQTINVQAFNSNCYGKYSGGVVDPSEYWKVTYGTITSATINLQRPTAVATGSYTKIAESSTSNGTYTSDGGTTSTYAITASPSTTSGATVYYTFVDLSCPTYSGVLTVGPTGTFTNLTGAIVDLQSCGWNGNITLSLQSTYTSTSETFPIDFTSLGTSSSKQILVEPAAGANGLSITSSSSTGTLLFDGQSYIYFNGSPNASNTMDSTNNLAIINTGGGYAIQFINNASNDSISYCNIRAQNTTTTSGTIVIGAGSSTAITTISIGHNFIGNVDNTHYSANAIYSAGASGEVTTTITVDFNNIFNFFAASSDSYGVWVYDYNTSWKIFNNNFYKTISVNQSTASVHSPIFIGGSVSAKPTSPGSGYAIYNNTIGYYSSTGLGTYTLNITGSGATGRFLPIALNVAHTTVSTVSTNTITAIGISTANTFTDQTLPGTFAGITVLSGAVNIGGSGIANIIGGSTGTDLITLYVTGSGSSQYWYGIFASTKGTYSFETGDAVTISYNNVGGFSNKGTTINNVGCQFEGIHFADATAAANITNNTIGSTSTANSICVGLSGTTISGVCTFYGISNLAQGNATINSNTIQNISTYGTTNGSTSNYGIYNVPAGSSPTATINSNTIEDISIESNFTTGSTINFYGINTTGVGTTTITTNTIGAASHPISVGGNSTTSGTCQFEGIWASTSGTTIIGNTASGTANTIGNITTYGNTASTTDYGIYLTTSSTATVDNNSINSLTLGSGNTTGNTTFYGVYTTGSGSAAVSSNTIGTSSNTISIGGAGSTTAKSSFAAILNALSSNTATTINSNTISHITTYGSSSSGFTYCYGIVDSSGNSTGTQIVDSNNINNITIASNNSGATGTYYFLGIHISRGNGYGSFTANSNTISTITLGSSGSTATYNFYGIEFALFATQSVITNTTTATNINSNTIETITLYGGSSTSFYGIYNVNLAHINNNINNNIIGATSSNNNDIFAPTMVGGAMVGIVAGGYYLSPGWSSSTFTIKNNTIQNLAAGGTAGGATGTSAGTRYYICGISNSPSGPPNGSSMTDYQLGGQYSIVSNNISNLNAKYNGSTGTLPMFVIGMYMDGNPSQFDFEQNRIIGLVNQCAPSSTSYLVNGVFGVMFWRNNNSGTAYGNQLTFINNLIYLSYPGSNSYNNAMQGIYLGGTNIENANIFYNTIHIDGTATESSVALPTAVNNAYETGATCLTIGGCQSASYIQSNIFQNSVQSTNNQSQFLPVYIGTTTHVNMGYNYVEAYNTSDFGYWGGLTSKTTWVTDFANDVTELSTGSSPSPITIVTPSGSLSSTDLTTVGHGINLKDTTFAYSSYPCRYDINGIATVAGDAYNRSTGYGHKGCWEAAGSFYWVNGTGNWSNYTTHWATSSGGTTYTSCVPSINDDAFFDGNSGGGICTIDATANCANLWCGVDATNNNYSGHFAGTAALNINGTLKFTTAAEDGYTGTMGTNTYSGTITFSNNSGSAKTDSIYSAGQTFLGPVIFNGTSGTWKLQDNATFNAGLTMTAGTLTVGANTLTLGGSTTPALTAGIIDATNASAVVAFTNTTNFTLPSNLFTSNQLGGITMNTSTSSIVVTIPQSYTVTTSATFTNGILNIGTNTLTLGASGAGNDMTSVSSNTQSSTSWINASSSSGGVLQYVNNNSKTYNFPLGDATHSAPISFNFSTGTSTGAYLKIYTTQGTMPKFNTSLTNYLNRYWTVAPTGISSPNYTMSYYYNTSESHTGSGFTKLDPVEQINNTTAQWVLPSGAITNTGSTNWTPTFTNASYKVGAGTWTSASNLVSWSGITQMPSTGHTLFGGADDQAAVLPIELVSFTANPLGKVVLLNWETASEIDNAYFTIEKTQDGINFEKVTEVAGAGNSAERLYYAAVDSFPFQGLSYYRLKQTDFDGKYTYSNLVPVNFNATLDNDNNEFVLYPNPVNNGLLNLSFIAKRGANMVVSFYDIQGRLVATQVVPVTNTGAQLVNLYPSQGLSSGVYLVKGVSDSMSFVKKVVVD